MGRHYGMYVFLLILAVIFVTHAAGTTGVFLAGSQGATSVIGALQGPAGGSKGSFQLGSGKSFTLQ